MTLEQHSTGRILVIGGLMYAVLLLTYIIYSPGLYGLFIFDDHGNLDTLERIRQFSLNDFGQFVFTGISSRLGRPVSMASFAVQFYAWPYTAYIFKYVNLMIHLINGMLVFWLTLKLFDLYRPNSQHNLTLALFTATLWLLHPIQVSTVSYVIQRMTELSALFSFGAIITYLYGRQWALAGRIRRGLLLMSCAIVFGLPLAVLSKENGVLIPIFIITIEFSLLSTVPRPRYWRPWALIFLALPIVLLLGYFFIKAQSLFINGYFGRHFNLIERLLTESRILVDYLHLIFFPQPSALGLFFDDYTVSKHLLSPLSTLFSVFGLCGLITAAIILRRNAPIFSFAVFWFFGGHLLESTVLPLELFFLHRNYFPLFGPALAVVYYFYALISHIQHTWIRQYVRIAAISLLGVFALITYSESIVWGRTLSQAKLWAEEKPNSKRAQDWYATTLIAQDKVTEAQKIYQERARQYPSDSTPYLQMAEAVCHDPKQPLPDIRETVNRLQNVSWHDNTTINITISLVDYKEEGKCSALPVEFLIKVVDSLSRNPEYRSFRSKLLMLRGRIFNIQGKPMLALSEYERSYEIKPSMLTLLDMVNIAAGSGHINLAKNFIIRAKQDPKLPIVQKGVYKKMIERYEFQLNNAMQKN